MKKSQIAIFVSIIFGILLLVHFVVYEAVFLVFPDFSAQYVIYLRIVTALLPLLFIGSNLAAFNYNNIFTRIYYKLMAVWVGLILYLFLAGLGVGVISFFVANSQIPGEILFGLAIMVAVYGVIHSQIIKIVEIKINLRNLPTEWTGRTIVFLSDLHLGQVRAEKFAERIADKINQLHPDIVLIGGDLYDGVAGDNEKMIAPLKTIKTQKGIYFITGNHDGFTEKGTEEDIETIQKAGITVLQNKLVNINGIQFIGADYRETADPKRFSEILEQMHIDSNLPSILIKHVPNNMDVAIKAGISFQLSGHTHRAQVWPLRFIPKRIFKGFDYGLKRSGLFQAYTSSGVGTWGPPLRVGTNSEIVLITLEKE